MGVVDLLWRFCDLRNTTTRVTLTALSILLFSARAWQSDLVVTAELAGLASMVATCVPLTYISFIELQVHINLQRFGKLHSATVTNHVANQAGFVMWEVEIEIEEGRIRKWVKTTIKKIAVGSTVEVTLTPDWTYCRVETSGRSVWRTTLYLAFLLWATVSDVIESIYGVIFGVIQAVVLLHEQGCSILNIALHLLFAVCLGGALVSNLYCCFWVRRHAGLPSTEAYEMVSSHSRLSLCSGASSPDREQRKSSDLEQRKLSPERE